MAQPFVSAPIIGANSVHQLTNSTGAVELRLSKADLAKISNAAAWDVRARRPNECALRWKMVIEAL